MTSTQPVHPAETAIKGILTAYPDFDLRRVVGNHDPESRRLLTTAQTMKALAVSRMTIWRLVNETKELKPVWIGKLQMFDIRDIDLFIRKNKRTNKRKLSCLSCEQ